MRQGPVAGWSEEINTLRVEIKQKLISELLEVTQIAQKWFQVSCFKFQVLNIEIHEKNERCVAVQGMTLKGHVLGALRFYGLSL